MANEQEFSKLSVSLLFDTSEFEYELKNVQKLLRTSGRAMQNVGRDLTIGLSVPLALATRAIVDTATTFEYQMARVQAISGASSRSFGMLQKNAEDLGASTIFTATSVGELQEEFAKLGFVSSEIVAVTESTLSLAQVTGADLSRAAEIAGSTLRTFGMEANDVGVVNDIVATAISKSALDFESFAETMKYAGSEAAINGISIQELGAAMGVLANRGVKGSIAGTRLRMIFSKLAKEGGNVHEKFLDLINGNVTMTEAIARFGVRAAAAVPVLQQNRDEFFALETAMLQSAGTLAAMQKIMDDTSFSVQRRLISALENLSIQVGKVILPVVNAFLEVLIAVVNGISMMPAPLQGVVVAIGGLAIVLGPAIYLMGTFRLRMVEISQMAPKMGRAISLAFGPYGIAIAAVVGLIAGFVSLARKQEKFVALSDKIKDAQTTAAEASGKVLAPIRRLIGEYENTNTTLERRAEILAELQRAQPDYFGDLDKEGTNVETLRGRYEELTKAIINKAKAQAFAGKIKEVEAEAAILIGQQVDAELQLEDIAKRAAAGEAGFAPFETSVFSEEDGSRKIMADPQYEVKLGLKRLLDDNQAALDALDNQLQLFLGKAKEFGLTYDDIFGKGGGSGGDGEGDGTTKQADAMAKLRKQLALIYEEQTRLGESPLEATQKRVKAFTTAFKELVMASAEGENVSVNMEMVTRILKKLRGELSGLDEEADAIKAFRKQMDKLNTVLASIDATTRRITGDANIEELRQQLRNLQTDYRKLGNSITDMERQSDPNLYILDQMKDKYAELGDTIGKTALQIATLVTKQRLATDGALDLGSAMGAAIANGENVGRAALKSSAATIAALTREIYLLWAKNVLMDPGSVTNPYAKLALFGIGAGVISGYLNNIPMLAQGGIAIGPQLAVVGDNRSGREAIIPLEKLPGLMQKMGGAGTGRLYGTIEGYDLVLTNERNNRFLQRHSR